ncbi:MAG: tryptophan dimethylallyltransferase family protein [Polyangiaceae bacterium]
MGSPAFKQIPGISLGALGKRKLRSLAAGMDLSEALTAQALDVFALMSESWADWAVGDSPVWPNDISDDGTPFEFSASFDGNSPRLRMLAEAQTEPISKVSSWAGGLALGKRLKAQRLADLTLFEQIQDLFVPLAGARSRFSLWHAAVLEEARPALFKAYVNPCLFGLGSAPYVVEQALRRLDFGDAWAFLEERLAHNPGVEIRYFSVDLAAPERARVKVYLGCGESAAAVDHLISSASNSQPQDAQQWLNTLTASQGPFDARPILSCFSFRHGLATPDVTVHVPIRCYVKHDTEALARVSNLMSPEDSQRLSRALAAVSERPLNVGRGLLTYASLRREASTVRVTVYVAPEAYNITSRRPSMPPAIDHNSGVHKTSPRAADQPAATMANVQALITRHQKLLREQGLLRHLHGPGDLAQAQLLASHLSLLVLWLGDLSRFACELASDPRVVARLVECTADERERGRRFSVMFEALGISAQAPPLFSAEHASLRELAFACMADVTSATDDRVRLGIVLAVSAICEELLSVAVAFAERVVTGAPSARVELGRFDEDTQPQLSLIGLTGEVGADVFAAAERCFESLLKVASAIDSAVFHDAAHGR